MCINFKILKSITYMIENLRQLALLVSHAWFPDLPLPWTTNDGSKTSGNLLYLNLSFLLLLLSMMEVSYNSLVSAPVLSCWSFQLWLSLPETVNVTVNHFNIAAPFFHDPMIKKILWHEIFAIFSWFLFLHTLFSRFLNRSWISRK